MRSNDKKDALPEQIEHALLLGLKPLEAVPGPHLRQRLLQRVHADMGFFHLAAEAGQWQEVSAGISMKLLQQQANSNSILLRLAAGATLPPHSHHVDEECLVVQGSAQLGETRVEEGDYHLALRRSRHGKIHSDSGATLFIHGTSLGNRFGVMRDFILGKVNVKDTADAITVRATEGEWESIGSDVQRKRLYATHEFASHLIRLEPGSTYSLPSEVVDEEAFVLSGEILCGDMAWRTGDYQRAKFGWAHPTLTAPQGALMYLRTVRQQ